MAAKKKTPKKKTPRKKAPKRRAPVSALTITESVMILDKLCSAEDPIWTNTVPCERCGMKPDRPTETTPEDLDDTFPGEWEEFHAIEFVDSYGKRVKGTLRDMIIDRLMK